MVRRRLRCHRSRLRRRLRLCIASPRPRFHPIRPRRFASRVRGLTRPTALRDDLHELSLPNVPESNIARVAFECCECITTRRGELDMGEGDNRCCRNLGRLSSASRMTDGEPVRTVRGGIFRGECKHRLGEASNIPYRHDSVAVACDTIRVERIRSNAVDLARSFQNRGCRASKIEQLQPSMGDSREKKLRTVRNPREGRDDLSRGVLLNDARVCAGAGRAIAAREVG